MSIYIQGGEVVTALGNLRETWSGLLQKHTPVKYQSEGVGNGFPLAIIDSLTHSLGSASRFHELLDVLCSSLPKISPETALITATTKGAIDDIILDPLPPLGQVWQVNQFLSTKLGLKDSGECISAACASGTIAILQGALKIANGECDDALIVGVDIMSTFVLSGFASLQALSPNGCKPFDQNRDGLTLGEGAGWILMSRHLAPFNNSSDNIELKSWGMSCDATHITAPCRHGSGLIRTLEQTLTGIDHPPGGINAHGTGTVFNDAMELVAFSSIWNPIPPVCSIKGGIGHCLGAAGIIESLISITSIEHNMLPPTVGLRDVESKGQQCLSGENPLPLKHQSVLSCNSGFGGINAALLFIESGQ